MDSDQSRRRTVDRAFIDGAWFSDIVYQAANDPDRTVELCTSERGTILVVVDGVPIPSEDEGLPTETFDYPLDRFLFEGDALGLTADILRDYKREVYERRKERADTETQADLEGLDK